MVTLQQVLDKIPNSKSPNTFRTEGLLIDKKYSYIKSQITASEYILRGMAILLQNSNLSSLEVEDFEILMDLKYHLLVIPISFDNKTNILSTSRPLNDLMDGVTRSQINVNESLKCYSYGLGMLNLQSVNLTELVYALS